MTTETPWDEVKLEVHEREESYISADTRRAVLLRDNFRCRRCGDEDTSKLQLHHVVYRSQGGGHQAGNLITLCGTDHRKVHDKRLRIARIKGRWYFSELGVPLAPGAPPPRW